MVPDSFSVVYFSTGTFPTIKGVRKGTWLGDLDRLTAELLGQQKSSSFLVATKMFPIQQVRSPETLHSRNNLQSLRHTGRMWRMCAPSRRWFSWSSALGQALNKARKEHKDDGKETQILRVKVHTPCSYRFLCFPGSNPLYNMYIYIYPFWEEGYEHQQAF